MKKTFLFGLTIIMLVMVSNYSFSQLNPNNPNYQELKANGQIPQPQLINPPTPVTALVAQGEKLGDLLVPLDGTFTLAMEPNDDGSVGPITSPFPICFYGSQETSFYINNNGNVSFGAAYFQYSPSGFPSLDYIMVAPFWGDVDTRGGFGEVRYKMEAHRIVVIWNNVGYYYIHGELRNTFELIITDGTDPLIGIGNNVAFSYTTMQWTTGDASGGSGGFGGYPATVGVNKGDGTTYALVGRFDHAGSDFNGAGGISGVSYLDGKLYTFDACQQVIIIPPQGVPVSSWWALIVLGVALLGFGTFYILRMKA